MKQLIIVLCVIFMTCKKKPHVELEEISKNLNLPNEVAFIEIAKKIFGKQFKEVQVKQEKDGFHVLIEYGGKTALTFASKGRYEQELKLFTAYFAWKYFRITESRNLKSLTLSLIKPYYVFHENIQQEVIEEVEVLRVKILREDIQKLPNYSKFDLNLDINKIEPKEEFLSTLEGITKIWKVELDEFKRVELK